MDHFQFTEKYKNLIFTPLDIPPPPVDKDKFKQWHEQRPLYEVEFTNRFSPPDYIYTWEQHLEILKSCKFTLFDSFHVQVQNNTIQWKDPEFFDQFPEVEEWFKCLPLPEPNKRFVFGWLSQTPSDLLNQLNKPLFSPIHIDELNSFGLRWFLNNTQNNLYFYGTKPDITMADFYDQERGDIQTYTQTHCPSGAVNQWGLPVPNENFLSTPIRINTRADTGFMMGQIKAAHVIKHELDNRDKATFIVQPIGLKEHRWNWSKLDKIVQQSIKKYPEETIWYEDFCD